MVPEGGWAIQAKTKAGLTASRRPDTRRRPVLHHEIPRTPRTAGHQAAQVSRRQEELRRLAADPFSKKT